MKKVIIAIVLLAFFLRFYNLSQNAMFEGDQGRDAIIVARIFREADFVLIGPVMSVGNIYLGPLYYYMMLPFLWLSYPSPLGPVYAVALASVLTVFLVYYLGQKMVGKPAAVVAAGLLALANNVVNNARFSWNPNLTPLFSLLLIYFTYLAWTKSKKYWTLVIGIFALMVQLHYFNLLAAMGFGVIWLMQIFAKETRQNKTELKAQIIATALGVLIFILSLAPLFVFDLKHDWLNAKAFAGILHEDNNFISSNKKASFTQKSLKVIKEMHGRSLHVLFEMNWSHYRLLNTMLVIGVLAVLWQGAKKDKKIKENKGVAILLVFLCSSIVGTSFYQHSVFDHHLGFMFPVAALILGYVAVQVFNKNWLGKVIVLLFMAQYLWFNAGKYHLAATGQKLSDLEVITDSIISRVEDGEKYNIVLLSGTGDIDGMKFRYFLEASNKPPVRAEQRDTVDKLFIINADGKLKKVVDSPIYEIVVFPNKNPYEVYTIDDGPEITVLKRS